MGENKSLKLVLDFVVLACVVFPLLALMLWVQPFHRGYFEDDLSLRLPYKQQSITEAVLASVGFALNVLTIILVEVIRRKKNKDVESNRACGVSIPVWLWESYKSIGIFTFGAACQQVTSEFTKCAIGRLRPHFFDVCQPVPDVASTYNQLGYIQDYTCTNTASTESQLRDMRLSFPSAHSSFAMYSAIFFILYIQVEGKWRQSKLLRHAMQFVVFIGAWYVGLTRVQEHMHHPSDVAVGFIIGAVYAIVVFIFVLKPTVLKPNSLWEEPPPAAQILPRPVLVR